MRSAGSLSVIAWLFVTACVESSAKVCGENVCPADSTCDEPTGLCIPKDCGDGVIGGNEECDGTNVAGRDCRDFGYYEAGTLLCSPVCTLDEASCATAGICGDHVVNGNEQCDGAPPPFRTCSEFGFDIGRLGCNDACSPAFAQCDSVGWHEVANDFVTPWRGIWGESENSIFAVGDYGRVFRFDGTKWTRSDTSTTAQLNHVWGTSSTDVFAVGVGGTIVHFNGTTWTTMTSGTTVMLRGVWGRSSNDVFAVGDQGTILHYNGTTWTSETFPPHDLYAVTGSGDTVIAVGSATGPNNAEVKILRKEGTAAWVNDPPPDVAGIGKYALFAIWGSGNDFIAVGGEFSRNNGVSVIVTFDGTTDTWTSHDSGLFGELNTVFAASPTDAIVAGHNGLLARFDGTAARRVLVDTTRAFSEMWGMNTRRVWASTFGAGIWSTDGVEWRAPVVVGNPLLDITDVHRYPNGDLLLSGVGSQVITITDTGETAQTIGTRDVQSVWASGDSAAISEAFAVTEGEGVYHRIDNGAWTQPLTTGFYQDVFGLSASNVYVVGGTVGVPLAQRYNGVSWQPLTLPSGTGIRPQGVWASGPNDVWIVGNAGVILHATDGMTFTQMQSGVDPSIVLRTVWGTGPTDVFAAGDNGTILHYDGTSWRRMTYNASEIFLALTGTGPQDVFAAGTGGLVHYDGVSWSNVTLPVAFNATGAYADSNGALLTGFFGTLLGLDRVCQLNEERCGDAWDNDCDGEINCADTDCSNAPECLVGGACTIDPVHIGCNESRRLTTFSGVSQKDEWPCLATSTAGSETTLRFAAPASGSVTFSISDVSNQTQLQLVVLDADTVDSACDVTSCVAATNGSVTTTATGTPMYLVVDAPADQGAELTLTTSCD